MAIQKNIDDNTGVTHSEAYVVIAGVNISPFTPVGPNTTEAAFSVEIYHNVAARSKSDASARKQPFVSTVITMTGSDVATYFADSALKANDKSPILQAYTWLKTQSSQLGINWTTGTTDV